MGANRVMCRRDPTDLRVVVTIWELRKLREPWEPRKPKGPTDKRDPRVAVAVCELREPSVAIAV